MGRCPELIETFPFPIYVTGKDAGESGQKLCYDLAPLGSGTSPGGIRNLIRGGGSAARIRNGTRPQDRGGGEKQLTSIRDVASATAGTTVG